MTDRELTAIVVAGVLLLLNIMTFLAYMVDKRKAVKGKWRTPEAVLLALSFFGGAIGGYISMYACHHKTRKWYFHLVNILGLIVLGVVIVFTIKYAM